MVNTYLATENFSGRLAKKKGLYDYCVNDSKDFN